MRFYLGAQYNCSVVARNAAGNSSSLLSQPFTVGPVINSKTSQDYGTVQEAIDAANVDDTINVSQRECKENVVVEKSINLIGPNAGIVLHNVDRSGVNPSRKLGAIITSSPNPGSKHYLMEATTSDVLVEELFFMLT